MLFLALILVAAVDNPIGASVTCPEVDSASTIATLRTLVPSLVESPSARMWYFKGRLTESAPLQHPLGEQTCRCEQVQAVANLAPELTSDDARRMWYFKGRLTCRLHNDNPKPALP
jgi:hypothetical protein